MVYHCNAHLMPYRMALSQGAFARDTGERQHRHKKRFLASRLELYMMYIIGASSPKRYGQLT
jgi:hypothetical protein